MQRWCHSQWCLSILCDKRWTWKQIFCLWSRLCPRQRSPDSIGGGGRSGTVCSQQVQVRCLRKAGLLASSSWEGETKAQAAASHIGAVTGGSAVAVKDWHREETSPGFTPGFGGLFGGPSFCREAVWRLWLSLGSGAMELVYSHCCRTSCTDSRFSLPI